MKKIKIQRIVKNRYNKLDSNGFGPCLGLQEEDETTYLNGENISQYESEAKNYKETIDIAATFRQVV